MTGNSCKFMQDFEFTIFPDELFCTVRKFLCIMNDAIIERMFNRFLRGSFNFSNTTRPVKKKQLTVKYSAEQTALVLHFHLVIHQVHTLIEEEKGFQKV